MSVTLKGLFLIFIFLTLSACTKTGTTVLNSFAKTGDYLVSNNIRYGSYPQNILDVYRPSPSKNTLPSSKNNPVVVFFYGGCWGECSDLKKSDYLFVAQSFASRGFVTVIADFRQYPEVKFESLMADTSNVIRWVSQNISKYAGDSKRIAIIGHSSGAHIASMLALNPHFLEDKFRSNIVGFVGLAGAYDFLPLDEPYQRELFDQKNNYASSQPINFISTESPPLLLLHGENDETVLKHNSISLAKKAKSLNIEHQLIVYPKQDHISILTTLSRALNSRSSVLKDVLKFLKQR